MFSLTIISGAPGSGKTTLAKSLADRSKQGVHIPTDDFFGFVRHKQDPSQPGSERQNEAILNAWCSAALAYKNAGYEVFIDGVIGPWWFDQLREQFGSFRYVLLKCDLNQSLARVVARQDQGSATPDVVRRMHDQFKPIEVDFVRHLIQTSGLMPKDVVTAYDQLEKLEI